jgi:hypothetical protein
MTDYLPGIFSLLVAAAGWFYIFYSNAATRLSAVEANSTNQLRVRLRRLGGAAMIGLAAAFYVGFDALERRRASLSAVLILIVLLLMSLIVVLGLIDLRLTHKIRQSQHQDQP